MVWYSHLFQNFPQFVVIHTVKGFGIVNKTEVDVLLELSCFFNDSMDIGNLISGSKSLQTINTGEDVEKRGPSYTVGGNVNWYSHYRDQYGGSLEN